MYRDSVLAADVYKTFLAATDNSLVLRATQGRHQRTLLPRLATHHYPSRHPSIHPAIVITPKQPLKNKTTHKIKTQNKLREYDNTDIDTGGGTVPVIIDVLKVAEASLTFKSHVTAAPSLTIFCCRLKSHLFSLSYPAF